MLPWARLKFTNGSYALRTSCCLKTNLVLGNCPPFEWTKTPWKLINSSWNTVSKNCWVCWFAIPEILPKDSEQGITNKMSCSKICILLANWTSEASAQCLEYETVLTKNDTIPLTDLPYSPDLTLCEFFLVPPNKKVLKGKHLADMKDVKKHQWHCKASFCKTSRTASNGGKCLWSSAWTVQRKWQMCGHLKIIE